MKNQAVKSLLAAVALASLATAALAADDHAGHDHDGKTGTAHAHDSKARFGGVVAVVKDVNYELVATPDGVALHVSDHGKPVDLTGASARLMLLGVTDKSDVSLAPAGDRFEAKGRFNVGAGTKAVATVTLPNRPAATVKFTLR